MLAVSAAWLPAGADTSAHWYLYGSESVPHVPPFTPRLLSVKFVPCTALSVTCAPAWMTF